MRVLVLLALLTPASSPAFAQSAAAQPIQIGDAVVSGSLRSRVYSWNWFGGAPDGDYAYPGSMLRVGVARSTPAIDWQVEAAVPILLDLPQTAVAPAPRGQLGLGASYFAANGDSTNDGVFMA